MDKQTLLVNYTPKFLTAFKSLKIDWLCTVQNNKANTIYSRLNDYSQKITYGGRRGRGECRTCMAQSFKITKTFLAVNFCCNC